MCCLFADIHFYAICWNAIGRNLTVIRSETKSYGMRCAMRPYAADFTEYKRMRDHLEHFDDRLPGRRGVKRLKQPWDLGNAFGGVYSFGGDKVDIGPQSLLRLRRVVTSVEMALKQEFWQTIVKNRPDAIQRLARMADQDRMLRYLSKRNVKMKTSD
jgi:hypothetical protein